MQRTCHNPWCKQTFEVTDSDLAYYERVSPAFGEKKVLIPPPTLCPPCRNQRRMSWRNDRVFYVRNCDATGERFISIYHPKSPHIIYRPSAWYSDSWDPMSFAKEIDWNRSFFEQFSELYRAVPTIGIDVINCENSDYCNYCGDDKNCYMDIAGEANEDCFYNLFIKYCKNCTDCTFVYHSTLCHESINCHNCYGATHSQYLEDCSECHHCFDCKGCKNCTGCVNLRGKEYCLFNEQRTKEEYTEALRQLRLDTFSGQSVVRERSQRFRLEHGVHRDMYLQNCEACLGNDITNSKHCSDVFNVVNCEDCRFLNDVLDAKDCYDLNYSLYKPEASYELCSTLQLSFSAFNMASHFSSSIFYCNKVNYSHNLFGCIGLKHKEYCIFNKQYTKEEYDVLVTRLIEKMRADGEWGQFFPVEISPFAYNETVAQEYFPLSKEEVQTRHWPWQEETVETQKVDRVIPASGLPDAISEIPDDVLNWAINSDSSGKPFRVIKQELAFYRQMNLPLPHITPDERHRARMNLRTPRTLWTRTCAKCGHAIKTSYAPEKPEVVYCESCYLAEVY